MDWGWGSQEREEERVEQQGGEEGEMSGSVCLTDWIDIAA